MKGDGSQGKRAYTDVALIHVVLVWVFFLVDFMNRASKMGPIMQVIDKRSGETNKKETSLLGVTEMQEPPMVPPVGRRKLELSDADMSSFYEGFTEDELKTMWQCRAVNDEVEQIKRIEQQSDTQERSESKLSTYWDKIRRLWNPKGGRLI